ncbi:hypothetical protein V7O66_11110 [Methanolobus sp. ZRKC3]|uniref:hypothetical protein n=1 Tax=Methanolobus sp. ZRKC3 TaxID=3125786 RepID=UPI003253A3CE
MPEIAVEIVQFKLAEGKNEKDMLAVSDAMMEGLSSLDGFLDRELLKNADGVWMDFLHWESMETALKATEDIMSLPLCLEYFSFIDQDNMQMTHYTLSQRYEV